MPTTTTTIPLSAALSIVARAEVDEVVLHEDVDAWGAPSECHCLVARGEESRMAEAIVLAEVAAGVPWRAIREEAKRRAGFDPGSADPRWQAIVGRIYARRSPFARC